VNPARPGAFVEAKAGTVLAEIAQLDPILVACYVPYADRERSFKHAGTSSVPELFGKITVSLELPTGRTYEHTGRCMACAPRSRAPTRSPVASSIRKRLIKVGARVIEHIARIRVQLPTSCPEGALFRAVALGLLRSGP
jgi:hypothetical protein